MSSTVPMLRPTARERDVEHGGSDREDDPLEKPPPPLPAIPEPLPVIRHSGSPVYVASLPCNVVAYQTLSQVDYRRCCGILLRDFHIVGVPQQSVVEKFRIRAPLVHDLVPIDCRACNCGDTWLDRPTVRSTILMVDLMLYKQTTSPFIDPSLGV